MSMSMDMDMASSTMPAMASSTAMGHDMGGHDSMSSEPMMMGMNEMYMTFFTSTTTSLYSMTWTPSSTGQYIGTCIFLIALAFIFRALIAIRCNFLALWVRWHRTPFDDAAQQDEDFEKFKHVKRPWRINEAATRAVLDTTLAGVSYLL